MDYDFYLDKFQKSADKINRKLLSKIQLEIAVGITLDSVVLKFFKSRWANDEKDPINDETRIFFSIWVNSNTVKKGRIYYNIHALKLRKLKGYKIASRAFADKFRSDFNKYEDNWENVSVEFGPLTLMQGWCELKLEDIENTVVSLAYKFFEIEYLIDKTLKEFENPNHKTILGSS